mgnify:FL=1
MIEFERVLLAVPSSDVLSTTEALVTCKLDRIELGDSTAELFGDKDETLSFDVKDSLVNNAKLSGTVNPVNENEEAPSSVLTLLGTLGALVVVVMNEKANEIGSVEPVTIKLED